MDGFFRFRKSFGKNKQYHLNKDSVSYTKGAVTVNSKGDTTINTPIKGVSIKNGKLRATKSKEIGKTRVNASLKSGVSVSRKFGPFNWNSKRGLTFNWKGFGFKL